VSPLNLVSQQQLAVIDQQLGQRVLVHRHGLARGADLVDGSVDTVDAALEGELFAQNLTLFCVSIDTTATGLSGASSARPRRSCLD
jgi:hypothetical protein